VNNRVLGTIAMICAPAMLIEGLCGVNRKRFDYRYRKYGLYEILKLLGFYSRLAENMSSRKLKKLRELAASPGVLPAQ
jgi:hypothetical protein